MRFFLYFLILASFMIFLFSMKSFSHLGEITKMGFVAGDLVETTIKQHGISGKSKKYSLEVLFSYTVAGKLYKNKNIIKRSRARNELKTYTENIKAEKLIIFYNPKIPEVSFILQVGLLRSNVLTALLYSNIFTALTFYITGKTIRKKNIKNL